MLNTIDTVIGFAVIMTVVSLLITILVQMVSSALSLRGKNLANALALTFQTIDPKIGEFSGRANFKGSDFQRFNFEI